MRSWKRLFYFLLLNVIVSALTTWLVVSLLLKDYPQVPLTQPFAGGEDSASQNGGGTDGESSTSAGGDEGSGVVFAIGQIEIDSIVGAGDVQNERVLIRHVGDEVISLSGWQLQDEDGNSYVLPSLTMISGGAVTVYSRAGANTVIELYWGMNEPVWTEGEQALLIDPNGDVQAVYTVP